MEYYTVLKSEDWFFLWLGVYDEGLIDIVDTCALDDLDKLNEWANDYDVDINDIEEG